MDCQIHSCLLVAFCFLSSFLLALASSTVKQPYVVYMGAHNHGEYDLMDNVDIDRVKNSHRKFLSSFLSSEESVEDSIVNSFTKDINGFTALLDENQAARIAKYPNVVSVFLNKVTPLDTTHSWDFMHLDNGIQFPVDPKSLWRKSKYGEDVIIANIDSGIWPESKSFSDNGYGRVPSRWKGYCESNTIYGVLCNKKLIGARYFNKVYKSTIGNSLPSWMISPRDFDGHGTHTLSTAAGNFVHNASIAGVGNGTAKGGSPRARVASYKACWPPMTNEAAGNSGPVCLEGDVMEAMDAAIHDGVDVISISAGGHEINHMKTAISIGGFHAAKKGIVVVVTAGNSGAEGHWTVQNLSPWLFTVAASSTDRQFQTIIKLGNGQTFVGASMTKSLPQERMYPIISAAEAAAKGVSPSDALLCKDASLNPKKVKGKLLVCLNDMNPIEKSLVAAEAGAVGMMLCNDKSNGNYITEEPAYFLPTSNVKYADGVAIFKYIKSNRRPTGYISATKVVFDVKPSPSMAFFSSKGPNKLTPGILKPDITAPGMGIIAANTGWKSRTEYTMKSGTSMSCPHVAGVVGLLKKLHPKWSPAAIKSALMTTAWTRDNTGKPMLEGDFKSTATPFNYGAGHIRPNLANDPGLVYDLSINDHLNFLCAHGYHETLIRQFSRIPYHVCPRNATEVLDYNYPSITIPNLSGPVVVSRTLKNVGKPGTYVARVREPHGISVLLNTLTLKFSRIGQEKKFMMKIEKIEGVQITTEFVNGELLWFDDKHDHYVRSPLVVGFGLRPPFLRDEDYVLRDAEF